MSKFSKKQDAHLKFVAHGAGITFLLSLVGFGLMFIFKLFAARYFGPELFGIYELIQTVFGILFVFSTLGISESMFYFIPTLNFKKQFSKLNGFLLFSFILPFTVSIILSVLVFIFKNLFFSFFNISNSFYPLFSLVLLILPIKILSSTLRRFIIVKKNLFSPGFSYNIVENIILLIGILIIFYFNLSLWWLVFTFMVSILLSTCYDLLSFKKLFSLSTEKISFDFPSWISYSFPLLFSGVFAYLIHWTDNIVIGSILDSSSVGIYAIAYSFSSFLLFFKGSFESVFSPLISEMVAKSDSSTISFLFKKSQSWIFGFSVPVALILIFFSKKIIALLYGGVYSSANSSLIILVFGFILFVFFGLSRTILLAHKKTKYLFFITISVALFNIISNILLISKWGIMGAAISTSLTVFLEGFFIYLKASSLEYLPFDLRSNSKFLFISFLALLGSYIAYVVVPLNGLLIAVISLVIFCLLFVIFLFMFKVFDESDLSIIASIEQRLGVNLSFLKSLMKMF